MNKVLIALVFLCGLSASAHALVLYSPPMTPGDGNALECQITNVGQGSATVTVEIIGAYPTVVDDGKVLASGSPTLAPMTTGSLYAPDFSGPTHNPHVCKFTVPTSKTSAFRASACTTYAGVPLTGVAAE